MKFIADENKRNLLPLWDYGWLDYETVPIPVPASRSDVIRAYISSDDCNVSFLGPDNKGFANCHGPFKLGVIEPSDFVFIDSEQFWAEIQLLHDDNPFDEPPSPDQWSPIVDLLKPMASRSEWIWKLKLDESHGQGPKAHEVGFVLWLFREYIFANPDQDYLERIVFGFD